MKSSKQNKKKIEFENLIKERILRVLFVIFVGVLIGSFIYFLLLPKYTATDKTVKIFFYKGERLYSLKRNSYTGMPPERFAVEELLKGPNASEKKSGYFTLIPEGTKLLRIFREGDIAFADFNKEIGEYGGGTSSIQGIVTQIVYTLTDLKGIKKVGFLIEGKSGVAIGFEGFIIEKPIGRKETSL